MLYDTCSACGGVFIEASDIESVLGGVPPAPDALELPDPFTEKSAEAIELACPACTRRALAPMTIGALDRGVLGCDACGSVFLEVSALAAVRRMIAEGPREVRITTDGLELDEAAMRGVARSLNGPVPIEGTRTTLPAPRLDASRSPATHTEPPPRPSLTRAEREALLGDDGTHATSRLAHDEPYSRLLTVPASFLLAYLLSLSQLGRLLSLPASIQFHELGHAIPAYLSGRIALPLPCGLTFWSEDSSVLAHLLVLSLSAYLAYRGVVERRWFALSAAIGIEALHVAMTFIASRDAALAVVIASGCAGELVLSSLAVVAFFFRMPDRLRWDFFRFLVTPFAAMAWTGAFQLWIGVLRGTTNAPMGSFMGMPGDGSGDLDRLVHDHGATIDGLARGYATIGFLTLAAMIAVYTVFAAAAVRRLERR